VGADGVTIGIDVGDRDSQERGRCNQRLDKPEEVVPVEPERLRVGDGGQHGFVENVEVEVQLGRTLCQPGGGVGPHAGGAVLAHLKRGDGMDRRVEAGVLTGDVGVKLGGAMPE
jgi:hypothetical protein